MRADFDDLRKRFSVDPTHVDPTDLMKVMAAIDEIWDWLDGDGLGRRLEEIKLEGEGPGVAP